jgi:hypothetical protein
MVAPGVAVLIVLSFGSTAAAPVAFVNTEQAFEQLVIDASHVTLFIFTSASSEASQARSALALSAVGELAETLSPLLTAAHGDASVLKGIATEFNIRTRRCPKLLLFVQRARQAEVLELGDDIQAAAIEAQIRGYLKELTIVAGKSLKSVLAVGGPDEL